MSAFGGKADIDWTRSVLPYDDVGQKVDSILRYSHTRISHPLLSETAQSTAVNLVGGR
jgi:hypothetical protein